MNLNSYKIVIGISGQTGAGKSTIGNILASYGYEHIEVDKIGHKILQLENVKKNLINHFGSEIIANNGEICRKKLGDIVFNNSTARNLLNSIVHPIIINSVIQTVNQLKKNNKSVILNAALLFTMGLDKICDIIVYVRASPAKRLERIIYQRNLTHDQALKRLMCQDEEPKNDQIKKNIIFINNEGSLQELYENVHKILIPVIQDMYEKLGAKHE